MSLGTIKMYFGFHVNCPTFLSDFNEICFILTDFHQSLHYEISGKSVWTSADTHGQTDGHDNANSAFCDNANTSNTAVID